MTKTINKKLFCNQNGIYCICDCSFFGVGRLFVGQKHTDGR